VYVEQATRSSDHEVNAPAELLELRLIADASIDDHAAVTGELGRLACNVTDLLRELAGGGNDECLDATAGLDALEQREDECRGLAGAGLGTAYDIATCKNVRD
jgi:hypothetical protein